MFGKRPQAPQNKKVDTIIGKDTNANGRMDVRGSIRWTAVLTEASTQMGMWL